MTTEIAVQDGQMQDISSLIETTVFLRAKFGTIGNSKKVKGGDVLSTDADQNLLRVSKQLLDSKELQAINKADTAMRIWLKNICLPYDVGMYLLPMKLVQLTKAKFEEFKTERKGLVEEFIKVYPELRDNAAKHLGSLYNAMDYPDPVEVASKFFFHYQFVSLGVPGQLKTISEELFKEEQEKAEKVMQGAVEEITALMRQTLLTQITHLQERLEPTADGKVKILHESAIKNVQEFLSTFELRNVTGDKDLAALVEQTRSLLDGTSATAIRSSDEFRAKILSGIDGITSSLSELVQDKPGRLFREDD